MDIYPALLTILLLTGCSGEDDRMNIIEQLSTENITIDNEGEKPSVIYTANISSQHMYCGGMINGMEQLDNLSTESASFFSGFNATAFLQPENNELNLWTVPSGAYEGDFTYRESDKCEVTLFGAFPDGNKKDISSLAITVEYDKPTAKTSKIYPDNHQTSLLNDDGITRRQLTDFTRPIYIKTIPRWRWVDATPIREDNSEQMKQLYAAYNQLITLMEKRDFEGLKMAWSLSSREKAKAEGYYSTPDEFFDAIGFESMFNEASDASVEPRRDWHEYKLKSYMDGKLVMLEDQRNHSPLRIGSYDKGWIYSITPYFSMIDGRVVVSR